MIMPGLWQASQARAEADEWRREAHEAADRRLSGKTSMQRRPSVASLGPVTPRKGPALTLALPGQRALTW